MKKLFLAVLFFVGIFVFAPKVLLAQESAATPSAEEVLQTLTPPQDQFFQARVKEVSEESSKDAAGYTQSIQKVKLTIITGSENGKEIEVEHGALFSIQEEQKVKQGEIVVVTKTAGPQGDIYYITDKYRIPSMLLIFAVFFALAVFFGRSRGLGAIVGLILSILILLKYVIPQVLLGADPVVTSLTGAIAIAILSLYTAHGFSLRTSVALASTIITLLIAAILSISFVKLAGLSGSGSEEAIFLQMGAVGALDLKGLLLGGIIIGALGVLDDITTSQSAAVDEIKNANPSLSRSELFKRGISVGREHIASLVNTLVLAYAGASFPLLLLFSVSSTVPFWLTLNSEFIAEEVVRTLVGSTALILAVPISTFLAAYFLTRNQSLLVVSEDVQTTRKKITKRKPHRK